MCEVGLRMRHIRDEQRTAVFHADQWEREELHMHLVLETEKLLRQHEAKCQRCSERGMQ